ncbi:MAG TPA: hypothetical protein VF469_32390 [Kofleriaceae bacterium]
MRTQHVIGSLFAMIAAAGAGCAGAEAPDGEHFGDAVELGALVAVNLPPGNLQASVIEIASAADLLNAVTTHNGVYIHDQSQSAWYFRSGNYLLGIEAFTQFNQELDQWIDFGTGNKVAPAKARVVGHSFRGQGWVIPSLDHAGQWPASINSVWVIGTDGAIFGMGGAPQGIPLGTEVFGSMQTYGGIPSTPYLVFDDSPNHDSTRIRAAFSFNASTLLGGHSAGSSAARRIGLDLGLPHVWLYGTPNYSRGSGAYVKTETSGSHTMHAEVINNDDDPVTNVLTNPFSLVSLAWGTATCHDYSHWDYQATSPVVAVCN